MKHTPGPWILRGKLGHGLHVSAQDGEPIALAYELGKPAEEANARLIAAAPDLLTALRRAEDHLSEMLADRYWHPVGPCSALDQIRAAIAKADGK